MMFNDTFNNISVCFTGLGLWCVTTLSTIFQFVLEGPSKTNWNIVENVIAHHNPNPPKTNWNIVESVFKHHNPNPLKQTEILLKVSLNSLTTLSTIFQFVIEG
jgi:hypothetical protein